MTANRYQYVPDELQRLAADRGGELSGCSKRAGAAHQPGTLLK